MTSPVEPRLTRGTRDLLPDEMQARQRMIETIKGVYERYGFVPLGTPAIEYLDVLSGSAGSEMQKSIFAVSNPEKEALGLRFDLTVPLARVIAQYKDLPRPFRRYQVSSVWRADKPGPGRFREFTQFDLDSVGVESEIADTEVITAICDTLSALQVKSYLVRFSSRRVLNLLLEYAGIPAERGRDVFRVIDKLDRAGMKKIAMELTTGYIDESGDTVPGLGLSAGQVAKIEFFIEIKADRRDTVLAQLRNLFKNLPNAAQEIEVLTRISRNLDALGYRDDRVAIDLSIARGLAYYTGPVFEAVIPDAPQFGSVFGGGRYDDLVMRFLGEKVPAVGASVGVDRLLAALIHLGRVRLQKSTAQVLVTRLDPGMNDDYLAMTYELRRAGICTELYLGLEKSFGKQIKYADKCDIPILVVYGGDEKAKGVVQLKDMAIGRALANKIKDHKDWQKERPGQREVPRANLVAEVKKMLAQFEPMSP